MAAGGTVLVPYPAPPGGASLHSPGQPGHSKITDQIQEDTVVNPVGMDQIQ